jgi:hypothetical protein
VPPENELPHTVIEPSALRAAKAIMAWGGSTHGGSGEPTDSDYIKIYSTEYAFAALKAL